MTTSHYLVYGGLAVAVLGALLIGKSLDRQQSTGNITWKTGCVGRKTIFQAIILGLVGGPVIFLMKGGKDELWFCVLCMMVAPFLVDLLRPTVTINERVHQQAPQALQHAFTRLNTAHVLAIVVCLFGIGLWTFIALTGTEFAPPTKACSTCKPD